MARTRGTKLSLVVLAAALAAATAPAAATTGCDEVRQLTAQGVPAEEIANAFNAPLAAIHACLQGGGGNAAHRAAIAPAGNAAISAAGPAPFGAAGPAPLGAAGPAPLGAPGPAPFKAAGGASANTTSNPTTKR